MLLLTLVIIALIAIYLLCDMVLQIRDGQFSPARSRTYAILLGLFMCGRILYGYFHDSFSDQGLASRGLVILCAIGAAVLYTLIDLIAALAKKRDDCKFVRRKLTFFLFMLVLLVFYVWMKKAL